MTKYIFALTILAFSCSSDPVLDFECEIFNPEINEYNISIADLQITNITEFDAEVDVIEGANLVFDYIHSAEDCATTADDEQGARIQFELDPSVSNVRLENQQLLQASCIYHRTGTWANASFMLTEGVLEAQRLTDSTWQVSISFDNDRFGIDEFSIDEVFTRR